MTYLSFNVKIRPYFENLFSDDKRHLTIQDHISLMIKES